MERPVESRLSDADSLTDDALVSLARGGSAAAFAAIMRRHNQRLYRLVRGVLRDESEAEDALQEAYLRAFTGLSGFRGDASLSTWLSRIALNEALQRLRRRRTHPDTAGMEAVQEQEMRDVIPFPGQLANDDDPERSAARQEIRRLLEAAVNELPDGFRLVFIMRDVEQLSVAETAACLGLQEATVKTRLHRARHLLRRGLDAQLAVALNDTFPFAGKRCERTAAAVLARLGLGAGR